MDSDADLDEVVPAVLASAFGYQGQKCSACSRLIVVEDIYDRTLERLERAARSLPLGPPERPENRMGAVIDAGACRRIVRYVEMGRSSARVILMQEPEESEGHTVPLTILADVNPRSPIGQEEIFGPVLAVIRAETFDEALQFANDTEYALTGGLFSRSPRNIERARREFQVGNLYVNRGCTGAIVGRHPFGGFRMSGLGSKAGGPDYLLQFMVPRTVTENTHRKGYAPETRRVGS